MTTSYWPLSSVYFFYFAVLGAISPYWSVYLQSSGFDAEEIGSLMAIFIATKLLAPNVWSYIADRSGKYYQVMLFGAVLTPVAFTLVWLLQGFWGMVMAMVAFSFFWNAILPQYEVITLSAIKGREEEYSKIRLWGSVGFIITVAGLGWWLDFSPVSTLPVAILIIMLMMAVVSGTLSVPKKSHRLVDSTGSVSFFRLLRQPRVLCFFLAVMLMQMSHGPYYTFFSIFMEQHGYSRTATGFLWALGVLAEVLLFLIMHRLLRAYRAEVLLLISLVLGSIRWLAIGLFPDSLMVILLAQCLHAATFGCFHATCIALVHNLFPGKYAGQGQALYSSIGFGIGGAIGAWGSGLIWQHFSPVTCFLFASVTVGIAALFVAFTLSRHRRFWAAEW